MSSDVESKSSPGSQATAIDDMKWSYRYSRINYNDKSIILTGILKGVICLRASGKIVSCILH